MPNDEYRLDDENRRDALVGLADRLGVEGLPDVVADNLDPLLLRDAYYADDEERWGELEREARKLLNVCYGAPGNSRPPGRGEDRGTPNQVAVNPSEDVTKRAEALAEVCATLAENQPEVQGFRSRYLPGWPLTDEQAREFLSERGGPQGTGKEVRRSAPNPKWSLHPAARRCPTPFEMRELLGLADKLSKAYGWKDGDALWFVLTGYIPPIRPLEVEMFINTSSSWPSGRDPFMARITVTAYAWIQADEVKRAFHDAQRQLLRSDAPGSPRDERTLEVVKFVARRMREHQGETWNERWKAWNRTHPDGWRYSAYNGFRQAFDRFMNRYVYRKYGPPNYVKRERTHYEVYLDQWNDRFTRRKGGHAG
jgi:hypothetical protein